ncbi:DUF2589 domain-containing protein [Pseudobutyrivibrio sp.]|uniref:DUF2589 domain-containing protein n=1 Tax=Pseudobutyrivibrio sp. TaxID=2014367 RepID=UPI0025CCD973|nr:DUF2589 domain-containing protein [Pseudobutyrivibrio sp.]
MDQLIGSPLSAAADASIRLANSTADFINKVGFDADGNVRNVAFRYEKRSTNDDGTSNLDEMKVDVPMLAIVPIPNLQVDEVNILFDMEVKQSERSETAVDVGATITGTARLGIISVSVSGSVSAHQANTRSSDNSAKYHVDVRATNHGTPEGLARVLDMMAANVAPSLVGSTLKDGNGQNLSEQARIKAEKLKALRNEINQIENRLSAAQDGLSASIVQLKKVGQSQLNVYQSIMTSKMNSVDKPNAGTAEGGGTAGNSNEAIEKYSIAMDTVNQSWNSFQNKASDVIKMIADQKNDNEASEKKTVSNLFALKSIKDDGAVAEYGAGETYYDSLLVAQQNAVERQKVVNQTENELLTKKNEYSSAISGPSQTTPSTTPSS